VGLGLPGPVVPGAVPAPGDVTVTELPPAPEGDEPAPEVAPSAPVVELGVPVLPSGAEAGVPVLPSGAEAPA
jgi:hypothetical protein